MTLPTSRNTTYASSSPLLANDINVLQDCIVGTKKPSTVRSLFPIMTAPAGGWTLGGNIISSQASGSQFFPLFTEVGDRVTEIDVEAIGNGVADVTYTVIISTNSAQTVLVTVNDINRAAVWGLVTINAAAGLAAHVMALGEQLFLGAQPNAVGYSISGIRQKYDRL